MDTKMLVLSICLAINSIAGTAQTIDSAKAVPATRNNVLYLAPVQFSENGPGFGVGYARFINHEKNIAVNIDGAVTFNTANTNRIYNYNTGFYNTGNPDAMCYLLPGIKFFPFGSKGLFTYAFGLSGDMGSGVKSSGYYDLNGLNLAERVQKNFLVGGLIENYLQYNYSRRTCLEAKLSVGSSLLNRVGGANTGNEFLIEGGIKIGYRI